MKKRIAVATSTGCLDIHPHGLNIPIIRLTLILNDKEYLDGEDIQPVEFYQYLKDHPEVLPKTSQPSVGYLMDFFEKLISEGYEEIFVSTISSKLSSTYSNVVQTAQMYKDKVDIHVFDTKTVCFNEGYFSIVTANMINENQSTEAINAKLESLRDNNTIFFGVNSLEFLVKNGRLSGAAGFMGKFLQIKPMLQLTSHGTIEAVEKIRTTKKSLDLVCESVNKYVNGRKASYNIVFTGQSENHGYFLDKLKEICGLSGLVEVGCSCVVGSHVGGDIIGIGIFIEE
ncbi:MAG: DegV family protein [bacterium]